MPPSRPPPAVHAHMGTDVKKLDVSPRFGERVFMVRSDPPAAEVSPVIFWAAFGKHMVGERDEYIDDLVPPSSATCVFVSYLHTHTTATKEKGRETCLSRGRADESASAPQRGMKIYRNTSHIAPTPSANAPTPTAIAALVDIGGPKIWSGW